MHRRTSPAPARPGRNKKGAAGAASPRHGLARVLSKLGICSRSEAARWIGDGRVAVAGQVVRDPEFPIPQGAPPRIEVDGQPVGEAARRYVMLNKPRGLVTSVRDERSRDTVYRCFDGAGLPWLAPVGRLDKASEGLLLFCNDPEWAASITDPERGPDKTYHVQVDCIPDAQQLRRMHEGIEVGAGERLRARRVAVLREGTRNAWLEITLEEGRNRQIRRLMEAQGIAVLRLVRVAIGGLRLGTLAKGAWRPLERWEVEALAPARD
ncbi:pseudouridine synthase [[Pseudomonas] boreopolis]|uniref:pseudouridine synthase n=1 Tax=Xanthomonas boreopolis TaxID=86183 RepID=UPI003D9B81E9